MVSTLILLPPLQQAVLGGDTLVFVVSEQGQSALILRQALQQYPKAGLALHPLDAPLHTITLPPLPANRRDAALRVKLEDAVLVDTGTLALAVHPAGVNTFHVCVADKRALQTVHQVLLGLGHGQRPVAALSAQLPIATPTQGQPQQILFGWALHRDELGAGAGPVHSASNDVEHRLDMSTLLPKPCIFQTAPSTNGPWRQWRWAALLMVVCAVVYVGSTWLQWRQLLALERQAHASTAAAFASALPNTPMIDATLQLQRAAMGGNALTQALAKIPADWPNTAITQWSWEQSRLSITVNPAVLGLDVQQQAQTTQSLASAGIAVTWSKP